MKLGILMRRVTLGVLLVLFVGVLSETSAQTQCRTANCNISTAPPAGCVNRASPYTTTVLQTNSGLTFIFVPSLPKIEPGDCIHWMAVGTIVNHSSSSDNCADTLVCTAPDPDGVCDWDSGNRDANDVPPGDVCFYDPAVFPVATSEGFYCRIHSSPAHSGTMFGTLRVTTPIDVQVTKNIPAGDIVVTWTGGGVTGDVTYKVVRSLVGDPLFTVGPNTVTGDPDGGTTGTTFTELGGLGDPASHYYLIRNKQTNEP